MKPLDIFRLIVRAFGIFILFQAVMFFDVLLPAIGGPERVNLSVFIRLVMMIAGATWFLFGAPPIERMAYPEPKESANFPKPENISKKEDVPKDVV